MACVADREWPANLSYRALTGDIFCAMKRREFLQRTGWFVVGASLVGVPACSDDGTDKEPKETYGFPQGVASGDPRAASVVLWTRVIRTSGDTGDVTVRVQVASDSAFQTLVAEHSVSATAGSDHTVRVLVTSLSAATTYYYRFTAGQDQITGQTRTAPAASADVQVNLAWVSCQDYSAGHYGAYRQLLVDDDARPAADKLHAIIHLGDMIYETRGDGFQGALDDNFQLITLKNADGSARLVPAFPSGGGTGPSGNFAKTVDDYRHLYRTFFSDPDLQAVRARWPFIAIWDDHEFTDDCWQSQANYTDAHTLDEPSQTRRVAASQAWFEYTPAQLTGAEGAAGVDSRAKDFAQVTVTDAAFTAPDADNFVAEANNKAAIGAITIYRSFRFGKHVELVMTDERSYRSDHAIPEDISSQPGFLARRNVLPLPLVELLDQGKTANGGNPPPTIPLGSVTIDNPRVDSPPGTMLGAAQKAWWKATMKASDATWKLWGNEVTMMRMRIAAAAPLQIPQDLVISADAWDGYASERAELMTYLKDQGIKNVVLLTGDIHASFAGIVVDNFDAPAPTAVACELVGPGVSSNSLFSFFKLATDGQALSALVTVDATAAGGARFTENLNLLLLSGPLAAATYAQTKDLNAANSQAIAANPHLKYVDTNTQGYGYAKIGADKIEATIVTINRPITAPSSAAGPGVKRTATFTIPKDNPAGMTAPVFMGTKPFPVA